MSKRWWVSGALVGVACTAGVELGDPYVPAPGTDDDGAIEATGSSDADAASTSVVDGGTTDTGEVGAGESGDSSGSSGTGSGSSGVGDEDGPAFGYPVGDGVTPPAGGWTVTQVLGHYLDWESFHGGHLAQDVASSEAETAGAPVYAIGPGVVLYAGPNTSSYVNVVLIEHDLGAEGTVCSFYGHLGTVAVAEGQEVTTGDPIATVLDWNAHFGAPNSHLHYVILGEDLCAASDAAGGALVCGYDDTAAPNGIDTLEDEPSRYTSVGDVCGNHNYPEAFISPSQFIAAHG